MAEEQVTTTEESGARESRGLAGNAFSFLTEHKFIAIGILGIVAVIALLAKSKGATSANTANTGTTGTSPQDVQSAINGMLSALQGLQQQVAGFTPPNANQNPPPTTTGGANPTLPVSPVVNTHKPLSTSSGNGIKPGPVASPTHPGSSGPFNQIVSHLTPSQPILTSATPITSTSVNATRLKSLIQSRLTTVEQAQQTAIANPTSTNVNAVRLISSFTSRSNPPPVVAPPTKYTVYGPVFQRLYTENQ